MAKSRRTFHTNDLDGVYLELLDDGVLNIKSEDSGKFVEKLVPQEDYKNAFSKAGKKARDNDVTREIDELLDALKIDKLDAKARFLAKSAVTSKSGDNLRSFLTLIDLFQPKNVVPTPIVQVLLSDRAFSEYTGIQIDQGHKQADWMQSPELLPDQNWNDLKPHDDIQGDEVVQVVKIPRKPKENDNA